MATRKIVICGTGFIGSHIAKTILSANVPRTATSQGPYVQSTTTREVQVCSRSPLRVWNSIKGSPGSAALLPPAVIDVTNSNTMRKPFQGADWVISLVGIMHGSPQQFYDVQVKGVENVAEEAARAGARLIHFSAIGADPDSHIPYRFARLSKILPFLPVFGGGRARYQPVYVDDLAHAVDLITRSDGTASHKTAGKIIQAGGPQVYTYKELMQLVLDVTGRKRAVLSLPISLGMFQGAILENLPTNLFTVTRAQIEQLQYDNVVSIEKGSNQVSLGDLFQFCDPNHALGSVHDILPQYLR